MITLYPHQRRELDATEGLTHVAYYHDMGLGKTYVGAEKMARLGAVVNLVICQKSKIGDWVEHFRLYYSESMRVYDLTVKADYADFIEYISKRATWVNVPEPMVTAVINYDLVWRRPELLALEGFTLMLDESSLIQNENSKRARFVLKLNPTNVILLSGTPTGGKYERLWSQMRLLGWDISKRLYWHQFIEVKYLDVSGGRSIPIVSGYKNVERLIRKMGEHGCRFLKTDEVFDMPEQVFTKVMVEPSLAYKQFHKSKLVEIGGATLVGDTTLVRMLYERQLCGVYSKAKLKAFSDLLDSTDDRLVVFYNFEAELEQLYHVAAVEHERHVSIVNGKVKELYAYEVFGDSVTFIQYQAGAMGLNLQLACRVVYYTLPLSSELYEQSKKRIHRIGQQRTCFYYVMLVKDSIEGHILKALEMRQDYTERLFERGE